MLLFRTNIIQKRSTRSRAGPTILVEKYVLRFCSEELESLVYQNHPSVYLKLAKGKMFNLLQSIKRCSTLALTFLVIIRLDNEKANPIIPINFSL